MICSFWSPIKFPEPPEPYVNWFARKNMENAMQRQERVFHVQCRQGTRRVIATRFEVVHGDLVFSNHDDIIAAFARGEWEEVMHQDMGEQA